MDHSRVWYREGLASRIEALEAALGALRLGRAGAGESARRIAVTMSTLRAHDEHGVTAAARAVCAASEEALPALADQLLDTLRAVRPPPARGPAVLLIVEDDPDTAALLRRRLAEPGREALVADSGRAVERALAEREIDLVILDVILPDADGRQILLRLRENPQTAGIPILVVSGHGGAAVAAECFALGADGFFPKPADPDTLAAAVAGCLQRSASRTRESRMDPLTGLPNRAAFGEAFERDRSLAARDRIPLSLALLDLDHLQQANVSYGTSAGDQVLRCLSALLPRFLRRSDFLARWGGGVFAGLFPHTTPTGAAIALREGLRAFGDERFTAPDGSSFQIRFSAGVVDVGPGESRQESIARAECYLYLAKRTGRGQVVTSLNPVPFPRLKVLLAEDDPDMSAMLGTVLGSEGLMVQSCPDGPSLLAAAQVSGAALVILDVLMPGLDGFAVLERLRAMPAYGHTPILMSTSLGSRKDIIRGFTLGATDYIVKPYSTIEILARVRRLLHSVTGT